MMALLLQTQIGAFETLKSFEKQRKISTSRTFLPIPYRNANEQSEINKISVRYIVVLPFNPIMSITILKIKILSILVGELK